MPKALISLFVVEGFCLFSKLPDERDEHMFDYPLRAALDEWVGLGLRTIVFTLGLSMVVRWVLHWACFWVSLSAFFQCVRRSLSL